MENPFPMLFGIDLFESGEEAILAAPGDDHNLLPGEVRQDELTEPWPQ